ncbi:hypothetical protein QZM19_12380 [Burkholderia multivorans]|uniref:hypothetical protein n=1 Tax=Burkholderia multivorans TaxID=87883 RepID=UPI0021C1C6D4|nr:hypothetical protein [Burkholderia multivorans]MDN7864190.1 hypothetical protein [Burkholderia multivorans]
MEENSLRRRYRSVALIATVATLALAYGAARHLFWASTKPTAQQAFSVTVDRDKAPWERPVIAIREGQPVHIDVHSREAGVLMAHEIPGALATCASGANQSLDLLPAANGSPSFMDQGPAVFALLSDPLGIGCPCCRCRWTNTCRRPCSSIWPTYDMHRCC